MNLEGLRDQKERDAKQTADAIKRYLQIVLVAVPALKDAALAGNVTCRRAMREILPLLPEAKTP